MSAREAAVAAESRGIEASQSRAIAARAENENRPRTALEAMASRLQVTTKSLQSTLLNTVFKNCSEAEFVALVIVSNAFDLNPLLREIYAFPKKGGGIQAIVGYDGWIKIAERHPQYDGYEAIHSKNDKGVIEEIEGICYRKDRSHPTKKLVYLKEFKRNTEPWNNAPTHMLDLRCYCQTIRLGLGVSGLGVEGVDDIDGGDLRSQPVPPVPSNKTLAEELDDGIPEFDQDTGEVLDEKAEEPAKDPKTTMTEVSEEAARELDNAGEAEPEEPAAAEQPQESAAEPAAEDDAGAGEEADPDDDPDLFAARGGINAAKTLPYLKSVEDKWLLVSGKYNDTITKEIDGLIAAKRRALTKKPDPSGEGEG